MFGCTDIRNGQGFQLWLEHELQGKLSFIRKYFLLRGSLLHRTTIDNQLYHTEISAIPTIIPPSLMRQFDPRILHDLRPGQ